MTQTFYNNFSSFATVRTCILIYFTSLVVRTAKPGNLKDSSWSKNGVGRRVSHSFGYGLMDAAAMVRLARTWKTVPEQNKCEINAPHLDK